MRSVADAWWPLALSWLFMAAEQPAIAAVVARLNSPEVNLAAYGGVVFPIALVFEAPIIMMLSASTELSRDHASYLALRRFAHRAGALLSGAHLLVVATPLYPLLVQGLIGVPDEVAVTARPALALLVPWTWAISARRMGQGVLIRYGHSRTVGLGTAVRLATSVTVLVLGYLAGNVPGVQVGAAALSAGVLAEALYTGIRVRSVVARHLRGDDPDHPPLRGRAFWAFYVPLMMTPVVVLIVQPMGSAAISRMPDVVTSLAVWPVVTSLAFVLQAPGLALNEVVVAMAGKPGARRALGRFSALLILVVTSILGLMVATPLAELWFVHIAGLSDRLAGVALDVLWIVLPIPAARVLQSWFQGYLVVARRTTAITEAVVAFALAFVVILIVGVINNDRPGIEVALWGFAVGRIAQTVWLAWRSRKRSATSER